MGEVEAKKDGVTRSDLRHERHTVSLLTDHLVSSPKYRGKVLDGEVAEAIQRGRCCHSQRWHRLAGSVHLCGVCDCKIIFNR